MRIFSIISAIFATAAIAAAPLSTPWHAGSTFTLTVSTADQKSLGYLVVRLTDKKADSCIAGNWKQLEILRREFKGANLLSSEPLAYSVEENRVIFGVTHICDGYVFLRGVLTESGASGDYGTLGLEGFHKLGSFSGIGEH